MLNNQFPICVWEWNIFGWIVVLARPVQASKYSVVAKREYHYSYVNLHKFDYFNMLLVLLHVNIYRRIKIKLMKRIDIIGETQSNAFCPPERLLSCMTMKINGSDQAKQVVFLQSRYAKHWRMKIPSSRG